MGFPSFRIQSFDGEHDWTIEHESAGEFRITRDAEQTMGMWYWRLKRVQG